jgi:hypothetical protein
MVVEVASITNLLNYYKLLTVFEQIASKKAFQTLLLKTTNKRT